MYLSYLVEVEQRVWGFNPLITRQFNIGYSRTKSTLRSPRFFRSIVFVNYNEH